MTVSREEMLAQFQPRDLDDRVRHIDAFEEGETVYVKLNRRTFIAAVAALRSQGASDDTIRAAIKRGWDKVQISVFGGGDVIVNTITREVIAALRAQGASGELRQDDVALVDEVISAAVNHHDNWERGYGNLGINELRDAKKALLNRLASQAPSEAGMVHRTSEPASAVAKLREIADFNQDNRFGRLALEAMADIGASFSREEQR